MFRSEDQGKSWQELAALLALPSAPTWSFPPRPWTSHIRWIAPDPLVAGRVFAAAEAGARGIFLAAARTGHHPPSTNGTLPHWPLIQDPRPAGHDRLASGEQDAELWESIVSLAAGATDPARGWAM